MKKNILTIAVAASLGIAAFSATAEDMYRGAWYAVPGMSYMDTDNDLGAKNGGGIFLKLGKELNEQWDIQGGINYNRATENTGIAGVDGRYKQTTLGIDALYMFSRDKFRPFLLAGVGVAHNNVDYSISGLQGKSNNSLLASVGGGAQYLINDKFGLQADLRHQWSNASARSNAPAFNADGSVGNTLLSVGGIFRFGAPAPTPVVMAEAAPVQAAVAAEPAAKPATLPAIAACIPKFETLTISAEKLFGFDQAKLQAGAKPVLDEIAAKLKAQPMFELVLITGHTDRIGAESYNQKLSEKRAQLVAEYLATKGLDASRLKAVGKGESEPVVACKGVRGKAAIECLQPNRRVVISASDEQQNGCK
jgi:OOP family OmpA-OmpF porin